MTKNTSYLIITFCYAYIAGIVADMLFPSQAAAGMLLWCIATVLLAITGVLTLMIALDKFSIRAWFIPLALVAAFSFGYSRHLSVNTFPDQSIATISIAQDGKVKSPGPISLPDTCRIRIKKSADIPEDISLRLSGTLYARTLADPTQPLDDKGRWQFLID